MYTTRRQTEKKEVVIDMNNPYVQYLLKIFRQYLLEEAIGKGFSSDLRLFEKVEQSRELFATERNQLRINGNFNGRFDESNTELIFNVH